MGVSVRNNIKLISKKTSESTPGISTAKTKEENESPNVKSSYDHDPYVEELRKEIKKVSNYTPSDVMDIGVLAREAQIVDWGKVDKKIKAIADGKERGIISNPTNTGWQLDIPLPLKVDIDKDKLITGLKDFHSNPDNKFIPFGKINKIYTNFGSPTNPTIVLLLSERSPHSSSRATSRTYYSLVFNDNGISLRLNMTTGARKINKQEIILKRDLLKQGIGGRNKNHMDFIEGFLAILYNNDGGNVKLDFPRGHVFRSNQKTSPIRRH